MITVESQEMGAAALESHKGAAKKMAGSEVNEPRLVEMKSQGW